MSAYHTRWRTVLICLCILGLVPLAEARQEDQYQKWQQESLRKQFGKQQGADSSGEQSEEDVQPKQGERKVREEPRKERDRQQAPARRPAQQGEQRERKVRKEPRKERDRQQPPPARRPLTVPEQRERTVRKIKEYHQISPRQPAQGEQRERKVRKEPGKIRDRDRPAPTARERQSRSSHDRHYRDYSKKHRRPHHYRPHETYHYHTRYLAPIRHHYIPRGYRLRHLPRSYIRIVIGSLPYFYFGGVFYRHHYDGYIVVGAPIGARVSVLPLGFIAFGLGNFTYYYVNDSYYLWDDADEAYVVVEKPAGADEAIAEATEERLFVYPNRGQSEERQAKDRYECHQWAVHESGVDPSLWDQQEITHEDNRNYKRALSACLEGRDYTVR